MQLEECLNFMLTKAHHSVYQVFKSDLAKYDVTPSQYALLRCLWDNDGQTSKNLADRLSLDYSTMTTHLDRLEHKGLITRNAAPCDRRALQVSLTDKGRELEEPLINAIVEANNKFLKNVDNEKWLEFRNFLQQLCDIEV